MSAGLGGRDNPRDTVSATRAALAAAFDEWAARFEADPEEWGGVGDEGYGAACADYLIELLEDAS